MKRILLELIFALLIATSACSVLNTKDYLNGGFESITNNNSPDGWVANNLPETKKYAELSIDKIVAHSGNKSIRISVSQNHPSQSQIYNWVRRVEGLKEGGMYELQAWVKLYKVNVPPFITVEFWNKEMQIGSTSSLKSTLIVRSESWQQIKTIFYVPKAVSKIFIKVGINGLGNNGGTVWFDDLVIAKILTYNFRYLPKSGDANEFNKKLVSEIQYDGRVFLSSTMLDGKFVIRFAVLSFRTHLDTIE